jgi:aromatic-L-amino-acid decarboxylase
MDAEEFRRHAHALVDWMADYLRDVGDLSVTPRVEPGDVRRALSAAPPVQGEPFERIFDDFRRTIVPGMVHWNHPGWFAYFPGNHSPPSILAEMLTATLGAQCMSWATSPAATELEQQVMVWLRQMIGLPDAFTGVIQDTASTATLTALLSARERAGGPGPHLTVYTSIEAHSSVGKGARLAGFGPDRVRLLPVDERYALAPAALEQAIAADLSAGLTPACVVATVGTTSSTAIDPLPAIAALCRRHGIWLHVDAAYAGAAAIVPELRPLFQGMDLADSVVFNPHKWLLTNFDCSAYFVRDTEALLRTFSASPEYLRTAHDPAVVNFRDWGVPLGRRFRALKLWFVLRSYGVEGLRAMIRRHLALAAEFAEWVRAEPGFEVVGPVPFGLVCFRHRPPGLAADDPAVDEANAALLAAVNAHRRVHLTHTRLGGRYVLRLVVGQWQTERRHVAGAWQLIRDEVAARV